MTPREIEVLQELRRWSDEFDVARAIDHHVRAILERPEAEPPSTLWQQVHDVAPKRQPWR